MSNVLIVIDSPLISEGGRMAGLQVRAYEMARALKRKGHEVSIASPLPLPTEDANVRVRYIAIDEIAHLTRFDAWIASPLVARRHFALLAGVPFVMDGYEAPFASFLAHATALLPELGERVMHDYRNVILEIMRSLEHADLVLCANENQRICYLSLLCLLGKINPKYPSQDLVVIVQSGAPPELPKRNENSKNKTGPVVLWAGGAYSWFDLETFVAAMPHILAVAPETQFVFAGLGGPGQSRDAPLDYPAARRVFERVQRSEELMSRSRFVTWQPYADRGALYTGADIGVCTYKAAIETTFSMRTRIIDMAWGGLPVVATKGDELTASLEAYGAGVTVAAASSKGLADAVVALLRDSEARARMATAARDIATGAWGWDSQIEALHRFCVSPRLAPGRDDPLVRRAARKMIQLADGFEWRALDRGWRAWWRLKRLISSHSSKMNDRSDAADEVDRA